MAKKNFVFVLKREIFLEYGCNLALSAGAVREFEAIYGVSLSSVDPCKVIGAEDCSKCPYGVPTHGCHILEYEAYDKKGLAAKIAHALSCYNWGNNPPIDKEGVSVTWCRDDVTEKEIINEYLRRGKS